MDAEIVARELYALRPGEFVAARDAKVAQARAAGERKLASEIKAMRRPTVAAWVTNLFALQRGERLEQLFTLGTALRDAQASLSGGTLRRLDEQRRQVIAALAGEAVALAADHGQAVSAPVAAEVEQTLYAALADADAAASVTAGRLTTALSYTGFGDVGAASSAPARAAGAGRARDGDADGERGRGAEDRRPEQLKAAVKAAERAVQTAAADAEHAARQLEQARARREQQVRAVDEIEARLDGARSLLSEAERDVTDAGDAAKRARAALDDARGAAESARAEASTG